MPNAMVCRGARCEEWRAAMMSEHAGGFRGSGARVVDLRELAVAGGGGGTGSSTAIGAGVEDCCSFAGSVTV